MAVISYRDALNRSKVLGTTTPVRHKCFIAYHGADIDAVTVFVANGTRTSAASRRSTAGWTRNATPDCAHVGCCATAR